MNRLKRTHITGRVLGRKASIGRLVAEIGAAMVALAIVVGAAVAFPLWLSRSYAIGLTAAIVIASILVLAFRSRRDRPAR